MFKVFSILLNSKITTLVITSDGSTTSFRDVYGSVLNFVYQHRYDKGIENAHFYSVYDITIIGNQFKISGIDEEGVIMSNILLGPNLGLDCTVLYGKFVNGTLVSVEERKAIINYLTTTPSIANSVLNDDSVLSANIVRQVRKYYVSY